MTINTCEYYTWEGSLETCLSMGTGSAFKCKKLHLPLSTLAKPLSTLVTVCDTCAADLIPKLQCKQIENISTDSFKTSQTYYQKIHQNHQQSMNNRHWRPPGLSSGPLWAQKHPQRVPRDPQETIKIHQRGSKRVPRGSQRVPRGSQRVPNRPPNDPKMTPERAQEDLGNLKSENLLKH